MYHSLKQISNYDLTVYHCLIILLRYLLDFRIYKKVGEAVLKHSNYTTLKCYRFHILKFWQSNSVGNSPWEAGRVILHLLCEMKFNYRVLKTLILDPILSQFNLLHILSDYLFYIHFNIIFPLASGSCKFSSVLDLIALKYLVELDRGWEEGPEGKERER
jgi:hypothetical protein